MPKQSRAGQACTIDGVGVGAGGGRWVAEAMTLGARAGRENRIASYQVCDFVLPIARDALLSRGMMGDGVVDFASITSMIDAAGYTGDVEVEIFNAEIWDSPGDQVLSAMIARYGDLVLPHLT